MRSTRSIFLLSLLTAIGLAGCGDDPGSPGWTEVATGTLTASQSAQATRAAAARDVLVKRLMSKLAAALEAGGPPAAVEVCQSIAPAEAAAASKETGVRVGRTSHKLRNPANAPPAWTKPFVAARAAEQRFAAHEDGRLGVLFPIRLQKRCLACHGPADALAEGVGEAIAKHYPDDAATGFKQGDLRGWFWVEVPAGE